MYKIMLCIQISLKYCENSVDWQLERNSCKISLFSRDIYYDKLFPLVIEK